MIFSSIVGDAHALSLSYFTALFSSQFFTAISFLQTFIHSLQLGKTYQPSQKMGCY